MNRLNPLPALFAVVLVANAFMVLPAHASKQSDALTRQAAQSLAAQQGLNPDYYDQNFNMQKQAQFFKKNGYGNNNQNRYYPGYPGQYPNGYYPNRYPGGYPNNYYPNQYAGGYPNPYNNGYASNYYDARRYHGNQYYFGPQGSAAQPYPNQVPYGDIHNFNGSYYTNGAQYGSTPYGNANGYGQYDNNYNNGQGRGVMNAVGRLLTGQ